MTTRSQVQAAITDAQEALGERGSAHISRATLNALFSAAECARYKSITGKPVTDPVYESGSDLLDST